MYVYQEALRLYVCLNKQWVGCSDQIDLDEPIGFDSYNIIFNSMQENYHMDGRDERCCYLLRVWTCRRRLRRRFMDISRRDVMTRRIDSKAVNSIPAEADEGSRCSSPSQRRGCQRTNSGVGGYEGWAATEAGPHTAGVVAGMSDDESPE